MTTPLIPPDTSALDPTLARHWAIRVRKALADPWTFVLGVSAVNPTVSKTRQEAGDYHGGPWGGQVATEAAWQLELTLMRKLDAQGLPDPGIELLRSVDGQIGSKELVYVQWYRTDGLPDAYEGRASVDFSSTGGEKTALQGATVTLVGYQARTAITKPTQASAALAVNEVQRLYFTGSPTGGTFKLKSLAAETASLTFSSLTSSALASAITGLAPIGTGNATVTGNNTDGYAIEFNGALAGTDVPQLLVSDQSLTGGTSPKANTTVVTQGRPSS